MRYFEVHKEVLTGTLVSGECFSDGEYINLPDDQETAEMTTGFSVYVYDEGGIREDTIFYPVSTNTETWENNEDKVLEKIKQDFPPIEWQNNAW